MTRGNLVDQFKKTSGGATPAVPSSSVSSSLASVQAKPTVGQWFQKNWGKAAAIFIVVIVTTIFIVRTVLIAKNKKKARAGAASPAALNQSVEWESFLAAEPQLPPHMQQQLPPRHMSPHMLQQHQLPPLPPMPPAQFRAPPQMQQQQPVIERGLHQQRLPPADGASGAAGLIPGMMPQSSRPQNVTFTIDSAPPVVAAPEKDDPKKLDGEEPQLMPPDVDSPSAGTEFNR